MATQTYPAWSTADTILPYKAYLGIWTNWSRGSVAGKTLTTTRQDGDLLIAFTAFFIAFVGSRFWRIASLVLHRSYSTTRPSSTIYHQRQVILRNTDSADAGLIKFIQLYWAWRPRMSFRSLLAILPAFLMALFCVVAFTVAGGYSSQITSSVGTEVLVDGTHCGLLRNTVVGSVLSEIEMTRRMNNALNYAQQCYNSNSSGLLDCKGFVTERIPLFVDEQAPCPFPGDICRDNASNLMLDTGFVNSHDHLGINSRPAERLFFRMTLQCAPLITSGFTTSHEGKYRNYTIYDYGTSAPSIGAFNGTHMSRSIESQYSFEHGETTSSDFLLFPYESFAVNGSFMEDMTSFVPRDELLRMDADTVLVFLSGNGVGFQQPIDDDWYRGTHPYANVSVPGSDSEQVYRPEEAASPMGCIQQYQFCLGHETSCAPPSSFFDAAARAYESIGLSTNEAYDAIVNGLSAKDIPSSTSISRLQWLVLGLFAVVNDINIVFQTSGSQALASRELMSDGLQGDMPLNQWKLDIIHCWATTFSYLQARAVQTAYGTENPDVANKSLGPVDTTQTDICNNQKIRSTEYASFNFLALLLTYILGIVIIGISFLLEPILGLLHRRNKYQSYANLEWVTNAILQTHRLANEGACDEKSIWSNCVDTIPTTSTGLTLASLDIRNPEHPVLDRSTTKLSPNLSINSSAIIEPSLPIQGTPAQNLPIQVHLPKSHSTRASTSTTNNASPEESARTTKDAHPNEIIQLIRNDESE